MNLDEQLAYLNEALLHEDLSEFLFALRNVILEQGGFNAVSKKTNLVRETMYKAVTNKSQPQFNTLKNIINALGYKFKIEFIEDEDHRSILKNNPHSLAEMYPSIAALLHPNKNGKLNPQLIPVATRKRFWWVCSKNVNHIWEQRVIEMIRQFRNYIKLTDILKNQVCLKSLTEKLCPFC